MLVISSGDYRRKYNVSSTSNPFAVQGGYGLPSATSKQRAESETTKITDVERTRYSRNILRSPA